MSKERAKGTAFETSVVRCLRSAGYDSAHRNALKGACDEGDISGVVLNGTAVIIECKNERDYHISDWLKEANDECLNAGADAGIVVFHRRGVGFDSITGTLKQPVLMTLGDLLAIADGAQVDYTTALDRIVAVIEEAMQEIKDKEQ